MKDYIFMLFLMEQPVIISMDGIGLREVPEIPQITTVSSNNSNILIEYTTIDDITSGALGNDYGKKVRDICNADYTVAQASGYANLCTDFGKRLKTDVLRGAPSSIKTREEAIKNIDRRPLCKI